MDNRFNTYNTHWITPDRYPEQDPQLRLLHKQPYCYHHPIIMALPRDIPGIYTIGGGRQIGKTTLLKQWIAQLLTEKIPAESIGFLTGELLDDHHSLVHWLQGYLEKNADYPYHYIIIDEITYIKHWEKGIKFLADAGFFEHATVILTGSDLMLMQAARMSFPGRRGIADHVDFHIYPLSFKEVLQLKNTIPDLSTCLPSNKTPTREVLALLYAELMNYMKHGGYLTAINDIAQYGKVHASTFQTYSDWIRGDMLKRGKQELYLKEILIAIIKRHLKQVSWHSLADALSIDSHKTVSDYCELLTAMDGLFIQRALLTDKLIEAPKKARKLTFTDPFIYHAIKSWAMPSIGDPNQQLLQDIADPIISAELVESIVITHYRRYYPTYYIKATGEIDIAYVNDNAFWPIEIKWRNQSRLTDLKHIKAYPNGRVFAKVFETKVIDGISVEPLPLALLRVDPA